MSSQSNGDPGAIQAADRRDLRRAARRAGNRGELLDAAERVFGDRGVQSGSLREIASLAGFSPAAIYLFFENKQHLLSETLLRRGVELIAALRCVVETDLPPPSKLHEIVDVAVDFFDFHPHFRKLLRHITGGPAIMGPALAEYASDVDGRFTEIMAMTAGIIRAGQEAGQLREGSPEALAHLFSVLLNEHVLTNAAGDGGGAGLTPTQFHDLVDGAFRASSTDPARRSHPTQSAVGRTRRKGGARVVRSQ